MSDVVDTTEYKGYQIAIVYDSDPWDPWDGDNLGTVVHWSKRYNLGTHIRELGEFGSEQEVEEYLVKMMDAVVVLPLYLMDHGGVHLTTNAERFRMVDQLGWDWGHVGFIYTTRKKIQQMLGWKRLTKKRLKQIERMLEREVEMYDAYINGQVYGYVIIDPNGREVDMVYGFYGCDWGNIVASAQRAVDRLLARQAACSA